MSKRQLIDDIRRLNPTAAELFLTQFDEVSLQAYLDRLRDAREHRIRIGGWAPRAEQRRDVA